MPLSFLLLIFVMLNNVFLMNRQGCIKLPPPPWEGNRIKLWEENQVGKKGREEARGKKERGREEERREGKREEREGNGRRREREE